MQSNEDTVYQTHSSPWSHRAHMLHLSLKSLKGYVNDTYFSSSRQESLYKLARLKAVLTHMGQDLRKKAIKIPTRLYFRVLCATKIQTKARKKSHRQIAVGLQMKSGQVSSVQLSTSHIVRRQHTGQRLSVKNHRETGLRGCDGRAAENVKCEC